MSGLICVPLQNTVRSIRGWIFPNERIGYSLLHCSVVFGKQGNEYLKCDLNSAVNCQD